MRPNFYSARLSNAFLTAVLAVSFAGLPAEAGEAPDLVAKVFGKKKDWPGAMKKSGTEARNAKKAKRKPEARAKKPESQRAPKEEIVKVLIEAGDRFSEGEYESAVSLYKRLTVIAPENREGFLGLGRIALVRGDNKKALNHFQSAVNLSPRSADAHFELGSTQLNLGQVADAIKELTLANELDPRRPEIQYRLSQAQSRMEASRVVPPRNSRDPGALPLPNQLTKSSDEFGDIDYGTEVSMVHRLITSGRVEEAVKQGINALKDHADDAGLHYQLGLMYKVQGDVDKSISEFEQALKLDPNHTQSLAQLTSIYLSRNDIEKGQPIATKWVSADPDDANAHFSLAWSYISQNRFHDALPHLKEAAQLDARNTELLNHLGLALRELGMDEEATIYFQRALTLDPKARAPRLNLAMIYLYDERNQDARKVIHPLTKTEPVAPQTMSVDAIIDAREGLMDDARKKAEEVLKKAPDQPLANLALGIVEMKEGHLDKAATILNTTIKNHPKSVLAVHALAEVYLKQGNAQEAIELARQAHERAPEKFLISKTLALAIAAQTGNTVEALNSLKKIRDLGDDPDKIFLLEGTVLESADDPEIALKHYLSLYEKDPKNEDAALKVAHLYLIAKKQKNAAEVLNQLLSHSPQNSYAHLLLARVQYELKDYKRCLEECRQVEQDEDLDYEVDCLAARSHFKLKHWPQAVQSFKFAHAAKQLSADDLVMLARALIETKETAEANKIIAEMKQTKTEAHLMNAELKRLERGLQ